MSRAWAFLILSTAAFAQTERGLTTYRDHCARCHGADLAGAESTPPLTGAAFLARYRTPATLLEGTRRTMHTDNPGGLTASQYTDTTAYVLSFNRVRTTPATTAPASTRTTEWRYYGADAASTKYSPWAGSRASATGAAKVTEDHRHRPQHRRPRLDGPQWQHARTGETPSRA